MAPRAVKVMWDYDAFPLWVVDAEVIRQAGSSAVPISKELRGELQAWSDRMTSLIWGPQGPDAPGWDGPDRGDLDRLNGEGHELAVRVREELDDSWAAVFYDETAANDGNEATSVTPRAEMILVQLGQLIFEWEIGFSLIEVRTTSATATYSVDLTRATTSDAVEPEPGCAHSRR